MIRNALALVTATSLTLSDTEVNAFEFRVRDQFTCRKECIDRKYIYFSNVEGSRGYCCSPDELLPDPDREDESQCLL